MSFWLCYAGMMVPDIAQIQLNDTERHLVLEIAERTGKPWNDVLAEALRQYRANVISSATSDANTWFERLARHAFIGCLEGGPPDLSTNPAHMEGFGQDDR